MRGWLAAPVCVGLAVVLLAGCGGDDGAGPDTSEPPTTVDVAALESWVKSLPSPEGIWWHCQAKVEADPAGTFTNLFLVAWDGYALADGPPEPVIAGAWREFIEAGTVWSSSVASGVDEPAQLEGLVAERTEVVEALGTYVDAPVFDEALPPPPLETLDC